MASQLEQARGSEHAFLLSISHDLRTPLTSIRGYAEALADGTLDDADPNERKRAATIIGAEGRRLERLVRDLLDLSRLDTHQFSLTPRPCDATEVVRDAAEAFTPQARELGIDAERRERRGAARRARSRTARADRRQPHRERAEVRHRAGRGVRRDAERRPGCGRRRRRRSRHPRRPDGAGVRPALHGAGDAGPLGRHRARASRSCGSSRPRWAVAPGPKPLPAAAPGSWSRSPCTRERQVRDPESGHDGCPQTNRRDPRPRGVGRRRRHGMQQLVVTLLEPPGHDHAEDHAEEGASRRVHPSARRGPVRAVVHVRGRRAHVSALRAAGDTPGTGRSPWSSTSTATDRTGCSR